MRLMPWYDSVAAFQSSATQMQWRAALDGNAKHTPIGEGSDCANVEIVCAARS